MILGAVAVTVVGRFVIVPDSNHGELLMHRLQILVGLVLGMALAVIAQGHHFMGRLGIPLREVAVFTGTVLVNVIPQVQNKIQIRLIGHCPVDGEETIGVIGTGHHRETGTVRKAIGGRESPGTPHRGDLLAHRELIVVPAVRLQAGRIHLHTIIRCR